MFPEIVRYSVENSDVYRNWPRYSVDDYDVYRNHLMAYILFHGKGIVVRYFVANEHLQFFQLFSDGDSSELFSNTTFKEFL